MDGPPTAATRHRERHFGPVAGRSAGSTFDIPAGQVTAPPSGTTGPGKSNSDQDHLRDLGGPRHGPDHLAGPSRLKLPAPRGTATDRRDRHRPTRNLAPLRQSGHRGETCFLGHELLRHLLLDEVTMEQMAKEDPQRPEGGHGAQHPPAGRVRCPAGQRPVGGGGQGRDAGSEARESWNGADRPAPGGDPRPHWCSTSSGRLAGPRDRRARGSSQ